MRHLIVCSAVCSMLTYSVAAGVQAASQDGSRATPAKPAPAAKARAPLPGAGHDDHAGHSHAPGEAHDHDHGQQTPGIRNNEDVIDYFYRKANDAFHLGQYERVLTLHRAILALDPHDTDVYATSAWLLWSMERNKEALEYIDRGLKANPDNWEMWQAAGGQYQFQKMWPEAHSAYANALKLLPKDANPMMLRRSIAHAAQNAGDLETSVQTWRGLVQDFPDDAVNKNNLARVEKLLEEKAKDPTAAVSGSAGRVALTALGLLGALCLPVLVRSRKPGPLASERV